MLFLRKDKFSATIQQGIFLVKLSAMLFMFEQYIIIKLSNMFIELFLDLLQFSELLFIHLYLSAPLAFILKYLLFLSNDPFLSLPYLAVLL